MLLGFTVQVTENEIISAPESGSEMMTSVSGFLQMPTSHSDKVNF